MPYDINALQDHLPSRIRQFRKHLNLSQAEFGNLLSLDQTVISAMETGRQTMTLTTVYALIGLGCNPTWLFLSEPPMIRPEGDAPASLEVRETRSGTEYIIRVKKE